MAFKKRDIPILILLILIFQGCKEDPTISPPLVLRENTCIDCQAISEFQTKTNYTSSVKIFNDKYYAVLQNAKLNGAEINFDSKLVVEDPGFYELKIDYDQGNGIKTDVFLFVIMNPERGAPEWGLQSWVPKKFQEEQISTEGIEFVSPNQFIEGIPLPVVVNIKENASIKTIYASASLNNKAFNIKRGRGSANINPDNSGNINFQVSGKNIAHSVIKNQTQRTELLSSIDTKIVLLKNEVIEIKNDITIEETGSLELSEGCILLIGEGVTIRNKGSLLFTGTSDNPILVTSNEENKYWGGFISSGLLSQTSAKHSFFCYSGYHNTDEYSYGHAKRQALFKLEDTKADFENCYFLDHLGQVFYPTNSALNIDNVIIQRVKTTGEISYSSTLTLSNSYLSDFPNDTQEYQDEDNDALYISNSDADISNCTFMYAKDDGFDSGTDSEEGSIVIKDSHFEACFHEGAALSGGGPKHHRLINCTFQNCGQGIELGFSSTNHLVEVENCLSQYNLIGIRYGDNYEWSGLGGKMIVRNSKIIHNIDKDIWNMGQQQWAPKLGNMVFENTQVSMVSEQYPNLPLINQ